MLGECCALRRSRYFCPWARFGWCLTARYAGHSREEGRSQRAEKNFYVCIIFWSCHRMWILFYKTHAYFLFLCCNSPPSLYFFCPPFLELLLILWLFLSFLFHYPSFCISLLRVPLICFKQFWFFFLNLGYFEFLWPLFTVLLFLSHSILFYFFMEAVCSFPFLRKLIELFDIFFHFFYFLSSFKASFCFFWSFSGMWRLAVFSSEAPKLMERQACVYGARRSMILWMLLVILW